MHCPGCPLSYQQQVRLQKGINQTALNCSLTSCPYLADQVVFVASRTSPTQVRGTRTVGWSPRHTAKSIEELSEASPQKTVAPLHCLQGSLPCTPQPGLQPSTHQALVAAPCWSPTSSSRVVMPHTCSFRASSSELSWGLLLPCSAGS